jgi:hypothetical protein
VSENRWLGIVWLFKGFLPEIGSMQGLSELFGQFGVKYQIDILVNLV